MDFNSLKPKAVMDLRIPVCKASDRWRKKEEEETETDCGRLASLALCVISRNNRPFGHIESFTCFFVVLVFHCGFLCDGCLVQVFIHFKLFFLRLFTQTVA